MISKKFPQLLVTFKYCRIALSLGEACYFDNRYHLLPNTFATTSMIFSSLKMAAMTYFRSRCTYFPLRIRSHLFHFIGIPLNHLLLRLHCSPSSEAVRPEVYGLVLFTTYVSSSISIWSMFPISDRLHSILEFPISLRPKDFAPSCWILSGPIILKLSLQWCGLAYLSQWYRDCQLIWTLCARDLSWSPY